MPDIILPTGMDEKQDEPLAVKQPAQLATAEQEWQPPQSLVREEQSWQPSLNR